MKDTHGGIHSANNKIKSCTAKQRKKEHIKEQGIQQHQMIDSNSGISYDLTNSSSYAVNNCETKEKGNFGSSQFINLTSDDSDDGLLLSSNSNYNSNNIFNQPEGVIDLNEDYHVAPINQVSLTTLKRNRGRPKNILGNTSVKTVIEKITATPNTT
ncbi:calpain-type cysteine protease family, partial [Striga asiatica]